MTITDAAATQIQDRARKCGLRSPIPGLIWAKWSDEFQYGWQIGFYEKGEIKEGWILDASGLTFYMYQGWLLNSIDDSKLDIENNMIVVTKRGVEVKPKHDS